MQSEPLRFNYEFSRVYGKGTRISGKHVLLFYLKRNGRVYQNGKKVAPDINRIGVTASKKVRTAVERNRIRRLLREGYREIEFMTNPGYDLIFMVRNLKEIPKYQSVRKDMEHLLRLSGVISEIRSMKNL